MSKQQFTDEELVAYFDGESEFAPVEAISAALESDTVLQARLKALSVDASVIGSNFGALLLSAPTMPELPKAQEAPAKVSNKFGLGSMLAAASLALVVGFGAAQIGQDKPSDDWMGYVAAYQALYANSTLAHLDLSANQKASQLTRVSDAIGKPLDLSIIESGDSVDYKRSQILGFEGRPLIQLAFLSKVGDPVALCIIRSSDSAEAALDNMRMEGMSAANWTKDGYSYLLIGGTDDGLIENLAEHFASAI